jgi:hypothetical protein
MSAYYSAGVYVAALNESLTSAASAAPSSSSSTSSVTSLRPSAVGRSVENEIAISSMETVYTDAAGRSFSDVAKHNIKAGLIAGMKFTAAL